MERYQSINDNVNNLGEAGIKVTPISCFDPTTRSSRRRTRQKRRRTVVSPPAAAIVAVGVVDRMGKNIRQVFFILWSDPRQKRDLCSSPAHDLVPVTTSSSTPSFSTDSVFVLFLLSHPAISVHRGFLVRATKALSWVVTGVGAVRL